MSKFVLKDCKDGLKVKQWRKDGNELSPIVPYKPVNEAAANNPLIYDNVDDTLKRTKTIALDKLNVKDATVENGLEVKAE